MLNGKKIVVILPAYNAEKTIEKTYQDIPKELVDEILVVDDSSSDRTIEIAKKLKAGWDFSRLPPLEKSILIFASYELLFDQNPAYKKVVIDQVINFSKVYCEREKYKYINKILDLLVKEQKVPSQT